MLCHNWNMTDSSFCRFLQCCSSALLSLYVVAGNASITVINPDIEKASAFYQQGDVDQAITLFTLSAYAGSATAQYNLAVIYFGMETTELNLKEFEFWLTESAKSGDSDAQFNLGMHWIESKDEFEHIVKGVTWLEMAAATGDTRAQYNLGYLSFDDIDSGVTREQGVVWLEKAAIAGDDRALDLFAQIQQQKVLSPALLYPIDLKLKSSDSNRQYVVNRDDANVYAIPVGQQTPVLSLKKDSVVDVQKVQDGWLAIKLEEGFPAWVPESQLRIEDGRASIAGAEAGLYVEPGDRQQSFKIGLVDNSVEMDVVGYHNGWVQVMAPNYFILWIRQADIAEQRIQ
jgi:hypothetical protein